MISSFFPSFRRSREVDEPLPLMAGYGRQNVLQRNRRKVGIILFFVMLLYALAFQLVGRFIPVYFVIPVAVLMLLNVWALPEMGRAPTKLIVSLFYASLVSVLFWPDYLAIALPGLPWITVMRLTAIPMTLVFMIALSVSRDFRKRIIAISNSSKWVTNSVIAFTLLAFLSMLYSMSIFQSFNRFLNALVGWTAMYFVACYVFSHPGQVRKAAVIIWSATVLWLLVSAWEWHLGHLPWAGHIPSILQTDDELVERILKGSSRAGGAEYRLQTKFLTPISFAEFLALATPFVLHWAMTADRLLTRFAAALTLPLIFVAIIGTDSRLGVGGFMVTFLFYALAWGIRRWRYLPGSILGPAVVLAYPVIFSTFFATTIFIGRIRKMVWGGGQHVSSNEARQQQFEMAMPLIQSHPWGYGIGMGAYRLDFRLPSGLVTVDSYYLTTLLDVGVLGFITYFAAFSIAIFKGCRASIASAQGESLWIVPATIALLNFVIIKSVLSQMDNHVFVFGLLGMVVALGWQVRQSSQESIEGREFPRPLRSVGAKRSAPYGRLRFTKASRRKN